MAPRLRAGDRVRLSGLAARAELNGRHGRALRWVQETGRWKVALDGEAPDSSLALKPECLEALPPYGEGLARTLLLAGDRAGLGPEGAPLWLRTVHIVGATAWELSLQYGALLQAAALRVGDRVLLRGLSARPELNGSRGVLERFLADKGRWKVRLDGDAKDNYVLKPENLLVIPAYRENGFEGAWLQDGDRHVIRGGRVYGPEGDMAEEIEVTDASTFTMTHDGETLTATLEPDGQRLRWSDGDSWVRPSAAEEALLRIVLVGPDLPEAVAPERGEARFLDSWPEPGLQVALFRGPYEDFVASPGYIPAEAVLLAQPALCASGVGQAYFSWVPALHALAGLAPSAPTLCACTGAEPCGEGEWLGDACFDEQVLRALGFEVVAPPARSPHSCRIADHPSCSWHCWAYTLAFRWPEGKSVPPLDDWLWAGYYNARRTRSELPRFRFRPSAPELRPPYLAELESRRTSKLQGVSAGDGDEEVAGADDEERACMASMEWVAATVRTAWMRGAGAGPEASAAAAVAAAEEFADRTRSRPLPPGQEHVVAAGACELAARVAASSPGSGPACTAAAAAAVAVFEALAQEALWARRGSLTPELVGHVALGGLKCAERAGLVLAAGVASSVGERASDVYELLGGPNRPPVARLAEEFLRFVSGVCESAGAAAGDCHVIARAVVDNLDLAIPAQGGREVSLRISLKMHDAGPCSKAPAPVR